MDGIRFEWDEAKSLSNKRKHGFLFEKAAEACLDPFHITSLERVVDGEERWQTLGRVDGLIMLTVAHTMHEEDSSGNLIEVVRIISAREATKREKRLYEEENS